MANQILAGAVVQAGYIIAGVDANNPPYVGPPIPTYLMAQISEGSTSGAVKYQERLYMFDVYDIDTDPIIINNPNGNDADPWGGYSDRFGHSNAVVTSNDTKLFIAADYENLGGAENQGAVYVYNKSDLTTPVATLTEPSPLEYGYFGNAITANDTHLFVSARGSRQIYVYDVSDLSVAPTIISDTRPPADTQYDFAQNMYVNDNHLVIGDEAYDISGGTYNHGSVSVYDLSDLSSPIVHLNDSDINGACSYMGLKISNDGTKFYIGVNRTYDSTPNGLITTSWGEMQIRDITTGALVSTITYPAPNDDTAGFASSIVETDDKFILSAYLEKVGNDNQQGRVYVYDKSDLSSPSMIITAPLSNNTDHGSDRFGSSLVADDNYLYASDRGSAGAGSSYAQNGLDGSYIWRYDLSDLSASPYQITEPNVDRAEYVQQFSTVLHMVQFKPKPYVAPPIPPASAKWVVVGAPRDNGEIGSAYVYDATDLSATPTKLTAFDGVGSDKFGSSIASTNDKIVVGVHQDDDNGLNSGSVYVFDANDLSAQPTKLTAFDGTQQDAFGHSVAATDDNIVVGAPNDGEGSVYVFDANNLSTQPMKLTAYDGAVYDNFGSSVAATADNIVVGAYGDDDNGSASGSVYVFDANNLSATPTKLTSFDGAAVDEFGRKVAAFDDKIIVGAADDDDNGDSSGSVYVYDANDLSAQPTKLTAFDGEAYDYFSWPVAATADKIIVGAQGDDSSSGSVYVYDANDLSAQPTKLTAFDGATSDRFGRTVAAFDDKIVVGSYRDDDNGDNSGSVYVYDANDLSSQPTKLTAFDGGEYDQFGESVAVG